jgi:hypothetical protein
LPRFACGGLSLAASVAAFLDLLQRYKVQTTP